MIAGKAELDRLVESVAMGRCFPIVAERRLKAIERKYGEGIFEYYQIVDDNFQNDKHSMKKMLSAYRLGGSSKELVQRMIEVSKRAFRVRWITEVCVSLAVTAGILGFLIYLFRH